MAYLILMIYKQEEQYEEKPAVYDIPVNFVAEGTVMWGMFKTRRAIEAGIIVGSFLFIIFNFISTLQTGLIILIVLGIPFAFLALLGLNDGPLSAFILDFIRHIKRKRIIQYNEKIYGNNNTNINIKEGVDNDGKVS